MGSPATPAVNEAIVQCLGRALAKLRAVGPAVNRAELEQSISTAFGAETAAAVMTLYNAGTQMPVDWRTDTAESVRGDLDALFESRHPGLTREAKEILIECAEAFGW